MTKLLSRRVNPKQKTVEAFCKCETTYCTGCTTQTVSTSNYASQSRSKESKNRLG